MVQKYNEENNCSHWNTSVRVRNWNDCHWGCVFLSAWVDRLTLENEDKNELKYIKWKKNYWINVIRGMIFRKKILFIVMGIGTEYNERVWLHGNSFSTIWYDDGNNNLSFDNNFYFPIDTVSHFSLFFHLKCWWCYWQIDNKSAGIRHGLTTISSPLMTTTTRMRMRMSRVWVWGIGMRMTMIMKLTDE